MGRYLGPKLKLSRRVGVPIADVPKHTARGELELPGMHGYRGRRNTEYGVRLNEKQKLRFHYDMREKQFRRFLDVAKKSKGNTANTLMQLLECRLDNVVYRMGFAATRAEARQLVSHRAVTVNGQVVSIASYQCKAGDAVVIREKARKQLRIQSALAVASQVGFPEWVEVSDKEFKGLFKAVPGRDEVLPDINENLVVELYSK